MNIDRQLATVRRVSELKPIEGADNIELAIIDGWQVVVKKGEFSVGQLAVYFEIDSWIPVALAPFLRKPGHPDKLFEGVNGERLKTIKLRGQISQGLLLPLMLPIGSSFVGSTEGDDLTEYLGVKKWERPIPAQLAGTIKGNFPSFLVKTDQPRIQNVYGEIKEYADLYEVSEKLDGSSMTVYRYQATIDGEVQSGVCSRNLDLKPDPANAFWSVVFRDDLINKLTGENRNLALQGELIGPGVQSNPYKLDRLEFYCFDIFDIDAQKYLTSDERLRLCRGLDIQHVPVIGHKSIAKVSSLDRDATVVSTPISELLGYAEGKSMLNSNTEREGLVFKSVVKSGTTFKVISNKWLLKERND